MSLGFSCWPRWIRELLLDEKVLQLRLRNWLRLCGSTTVIYFNVTGLINPFAITSCSKSEVGSARDTHLTQDITINLQEKFAWTTCSFSDVWIHYFGSSSRAVRAAETELRPGTSPVSSGLNDSYLDSPPQTGWRGVGGRPGGGWLCASSLLPLAWCRLLLPPRAIVSRRHSCLVFP